jgi:hypothetical protein
MKQNSMRRKVQRGLPYNRTRPKARRQRAEQKLGPVHNSRHTGPSGFSGFGTMEDIEEHHARDGTSTSLVSSRTHAQLEKVDPMDEGAEAEGSSG